MLHWYSSCIHSYFSTVPYIRFNYGVIENHDIVGLCIRLHMAMTYRACAGKLLTVAVFLSLALKAYAVWEACNGVSGTCLDTRSYTCTVGTLTGRCPGPSYNRCCPSTGGIASSGCRTNGGLCKRTATCTSGKIFTGLCPGPSTVTCCSQFSSAPPQSNNFANDLVRTASNEHASYGSLRECASSTMSNRIGEYWSAIGQNWNGCNRNIPWSAAFISFMVLRAGGSATQAVTTSISMTHFLEVVVCMDQWWTSV